MGEPSLKVLEVAGGDGRLTAYLKASLDNTNEGPQVDIVCTDNGRNGLHFRSPYRCALVICMVPICC